MIQDIKMQLPTPERPVPVATAITIVLDGHMPARNDNLSLIIIFDGTAKPIPENSPVAELIAVFIPIICPY